MEKLGDQPKEYEVKIERIQADGHLNDRTIRKYRALAIEFEEFLDLLSDDGKRSWREVFTENIHTMTSSNDPVKYDVAQNSMRKVLTGYLANLKAPDGRTYGASSYCVRRSAIRWYVEREYGYEMSRTRGWNNIFKVVHTIKNSYNSSQPIQTKISKSKSVNNASLNNALNNDTLNGASFNSATFNNSGLSQSLSLNLGHNLTSLSQNIQNSNSNSIPNSSITNSTLTNLTLLPTSTAQSVILNPNQLQFNNASFMPYIKHQKSSPTIVRSNSPKSITLSSPKTITLNPIQTHMSNSHISSSMQTSHLQTAHLQNSHLSNSNLSNVHLQNSHLNNSLATNGHLANLSNLANQTNSTPSSVSPASAVTQITQLTHALSEEDLHKIYDLFYAKNTENGVEVNVMNNPVLACSYVYFQLTSYFTRFLDFPIDETLKISELQRDSNGLTLSPNLIAQFKSKISDYTSTGDREDQEVTINWKTVPCMTDKLFLEVFDNYLMKRKESLPQHPDYRDPGKLFLIPVGASFVQNTEENVTNISEVVKMERDQRWFTCCPHSKYSTSQIIPNLCKLAKLSKAYTSASLKFLPRDIDLEEIGANYGLEFYDTIDKIEECEDKIELEVEKPVEKPESESLIASKSVTRNSLKSPKISKIIIQKHNIKAERELSSPPPLKRLKTSENSNFSSPISSNSDDDVLIRQVLVNQQTIMNNQASLESGMQSIVERIESIEKQLPKLKAQQRRRAVMCRRGVVTIRWHQMVSKKRRRKNDKKVKQ